MISNTNYVLVITQSDLHGKLLIDLQLSTINNSRVHQCSNHFNILRIDILYELLHILFNGLNGYGLMAFCSF